MSLRDMVNETWQDVKDKLADARYELELGLYSLTAPYHAAKGFRGSRAARIAALMTPPAMVLAYAGAGSMGCAGDNSGGSKAGPGPAPITGDTTSSLPGDPAQNGYDNINVWGYFFTDNVAVDGDIPQSGTYKHDMSAAEFIHRYDTNNNFKDLVNAMWRTSAASANPSLQGDQTALDNEVDEWVHALKNGVDPDLMDGTLAVTFKYTPGTSGDLGVIELYTMTEQGPQLFGVVDLSPSYANNGVDIAGVTPVVDHVEQNPLP